MRSLALALALLALTAAQASALEVRALPGRTAEGGQQQFAVIYGPGDPETVELVPVSGTATAGADFATDPVVSRGGGYHEGRWYDEVWVNLERDELVEGDETFSLQTRDGAVSATATIQDFDETNVYAGTDGGYVQAGERDGRLSVPITVQTERPVSVDFRTVDGVARAGRDYVATSGRVDFPKGTTTKTIDVAFGDDAVNDRYVKAFYVLFTGDDVYDWVARIRIVDDDYTRLVVEPVTVREGDGPTTVEVPVRLTLPSSSLITAPLVPEAGWAPPGVAAALPGADFVARETRVTFPAGATQAVAELELVGDDVLEGPEPLFVHYPWGIQLEPVDGAYITVEDDDAADVATAGDQDLLAIGAPTLMGSRTVGVRARCLRTRRPCVGRMTLAAAGTKRRRPLRVSPGKIATVRFGVPPRARQAKVAAVVRHGAGRTARATASGLLRPR